MDYSGNCIVPSALEEPYIINIAACMPTLDRDVSGALQNLADHGQKMDGNELMKHLQSRGYRLHGRSRLDDAPDPFEGFKEYYAASTALTT